MFENVYFFHIVFGAMFCDLERFWLHFGRLWGIQKLKKMVKNRSRTCLGRPLDALSLQSSNLKRFLIDFYRFGANFWHVFAFRAASQIVLCAQILPKQAIMEIEGLCFAKAIVLGETCVKH